MISILNNILKVITKMRDLILFLTILTPAYASSTPAFLMMYSTYKLNKQGDNIQPWRTPFPIWNHYKSLKERLIPWYSFLTAFYVFNFPQVHFSYQPDWSIYKELHPVQFSIPHTIAYQIKF